MIVFNFDALSLLQVLGLQCFQFPVSKFMGQNRFMFDSSLIKREHPQVPLLAFLFG